MIYAIGHDVVKNSRIEYLYLKYNDAFAKKILTQLEFAVYKNKLNKINYLAKRFAAKEAFAKACKTGLRYPITLQNISILNDRLGQPYFLFAPEIDHWLKNKKITKHHLSISDEIDLSSAIVILEI